MRYAIIASEKDIAGMNIRERLTESKTDRIKDVSLHTLKEETIYSDNLELDADAYIFATRHKAKAGIKTLTVHTPGNWGKAEYGGKDKKLCVSYANLIKAMYLKLKENNDTDYQVSLECTHHGPHIQKPCMFIEIGSTEKEWKDEKAAKIIAKTITEVLSSDIPDHKAAIGLGGMHYCDNFNKVLERTDIAIGHICPKHQLQNMDEDMLKQALEKNQEKTGLALLDWKGMGAEKQRIIQLLEKLNIEYKRTDKII